MVRIGGSPRVPPLVLQEVHRQRCDDLFAPPGRRFNLVDLAADPADPPAATAVVDTAYGGTVELRQFWTNPALPKRVLTRRLMACLADLLRSSGCRRLLTGVAEDDLDGLRCLESAGFERAADAAPPGVLFLELAL